MHQFINLLLAFAVSMAGVTAALGATWAVFLILLAAVVSLQAAGVGVARGAHCLVPTSSVARPQLRAAQQRQQRQTRDRMTPLRATQNLGAACAC